jgi:hypothetical protein
MNRYRARPDLSMAPLYWILGAGLAAIVISIVAALVFADQAVAGTGEVVNWKFHVASVEGRRECWGLHLNGPDGRRAVCVPESTWSSAQTGDAF